jgi:hypothetical protein
VLSSHEEKHEDILDEAARFIFGNSFGTETKGRRIDCSGVLRLWICIQTVVGLLDCAEPGSTVLQYVSNYTYMAVVSATQITRVSL